MPDRIHNQITMVSATLDGLRLEYPAAKAFYAVLTPEQRAILDGPMKMAMPPAAPPPPPCERRETARAPRPRIDAPIKRDWELTSALRLQR
ncbi:MAG: hypothetical protein WDM89_20545 [Rhizomicrobium sp.]